MYFKYPLGISSAKSKQNTLRKQNEHSKKKLTFKENIKIKNPIIRLLRF